MRMLEGQIDRRGELEDLMIDIINM